MPEKENYEAYMLYGIKENISFKKCIENEILIILLSLPSIIIGVKDNILGLLGILPIVFYFIFILKLKKGQVIEGIKYILHNGVFALCLSFVFGLAGMEILLYLFKGKERIIAISLIGIGYILVILLYSYIIRKLIEKKNYSNVKKAKGSSLLALCGVLGITVARVFLNDMDTRTAMQLLCILCFFMSYLVLLGIFNIVKFQYLTKHKEMLDI